VTKLSGNQFELEAWSHELISPVVFLGECVTLAEREGYDFFTVANWIDEEHRGYAFVWFSTRGRITLHVARPDTLEAVFSVTEIKPNVHTDSIKRKRLAEREEMVDRDLKAGFIY
jgi:hypothetical protein